MNVLPKNAYNVVCGISKRRGSKRKTVIQLFGNMAYPNLKCLISCNERNGAYVNIYHGNSNKK